MFGKKINLVRVAHASLTLRHKRPHKFYQIYKKVISKFSRTAHPNFPQSSFFGL